MNHLFNHKDVTVTVCKDTEEWINHLHARLKEAVSLAEEIKRLNPQCLSIGAGMLANLQEKASKIVSESCHKPLPEEFEKTYTDLGYMNGWGDKDPRPKGSSHTEEVLFYRSSSGTDKHFVNHKRKYFYQIDSS